MPLLIVLAVGMASCVSSEPSASTSGPTTSAVADSQMTTTTAVERGTAAPVTEGGEIVFSGDVVLPEGFTVPDGEVWEFDPEVSTIVEVSANVIVEGTLVMRPASSGVTHTLRFVDVDEDRFVGGGLEVLDSDVGLWVMGAGRLDIHGAPKTAWSYEWQRGWEGDEVVATPVEAGEYDTFRQVSSAADVPPANALGLSPELLNLSRNVVIEGTPEGRAHVLIRSSSPQQIRYAVFRYLGPFLGDGGERTQSSDVTGRYGVHFHHSGDGSRGSVLEGVVVRDTENHAFVTHASHGVTLRETIAFNTRHAAYWWDQTTRKNPGNESHDILYERAVAAGVAAGNGRDGGFQLGEGNGNAVVDSVAVGITNDGSAVAGYLWKGPEDGVWRFEGNIAHNNVGSGILVWVNTATTHVIEDFTAYHNSQPGIIHGAYRNSYVYKDLTLLANDQKRNNGVAIESHAIGRPSSDGGTDAQVWDGIDSGGAVLRTAGHAQDPTAPVRFVDCDFSSIIIGEGPGHPSIYEFIDCGLGPADVEIEFMHPDSIIRFQNGTEAVEMDATLTVANIAPFA